MSFASYLINESKLLDEEYEFPKDNSGFDEDDFGELKIEKPNTEGLNAAKNALDNFTVASDGRDTDVNSSIDFSYPKKFQVKDSKEEYDASENVDPYTVISDNKEADQFSTSEENEIKNSNEKIEENSNILDSLTGWEDLF